MTTRERIHNFFEHPKGFAAKLTQVIIFALIILSLVNLVVEFRYPEIFAAYEVLFHQLEYVILAVFTVEYVLRVGTAKNKWQFARKPMSIVDFLAVFPTYIEFALHLTVNTSGIRALRLIKVLRLFRALRAFKLLHFGTFFRKIVRYEGTILQTITPIILMFVGTKGVIWILEVNGLWIRDPSLGELFAIIGFALGIILSQKIGVTYDKFNQVEEAAVRLTATLMSLRQILNNVEGNLGTKTCHAWAKAFVDLLEHPETDNRKIHKANAQLYEVMRRAEDTPAEIAVMHGEICRDAAYCLKKKVRLTPKAYDTLLHQATILYFALIAIFIPGVTGMISVVIATYILYGMFNLTEDLDSIIGGEFTLINIDISELQAFVAEGA